MALPSYRRPALDAVVHGETVTSPPPALSPASPPAPPEHARRLDLVGEHRGFLFYQLPL